MHPMTLMAVARDIEKERQRDWHDRQRRSSALARRAQGVEASYAAPLLAGRLLAAIRLRPRAS